MSEDILAELHSLRAEMQTALSGVLAPAEIEAIRIRYLGRKGAVKGFMDRLGQVDAGLRPQVGRELNDMKVWLTAALAAKQGDQAQSGKSRGSGIDVTLPGRQLAGGHLHPLTQVLDDVIALFARMGFEVGSGPDVESDANNFTALNVPPDHPAREMQDTFYLAGSPLLMRTHTSPVQIRWMRKHRPPFRMIAPGRVFRRDLDVSHSPVFHQVEGLMVGPDVSMAHLKGVLGAFVRGFFGVTIKFRLRPSYFPFTEPSCEMDISCVHCHGTGAGGCKICKGSGWLEVLGCGMVHPAVFANVGYGKHGKIQGFAFGVGIERLAMIQYKIPDIRLFYQGDVRFLKQF